MATVESIDAGHLIRCFFGFFIRKLILIKHINIQSTFSHFRSFLNSWLKMKLTAVDFSGADIYTKKITQICRKKGKATFSFSARTSKQRTEKKENRYWLNNSNFKMNYVSKDGNFSQRCCQISHWILPQFTQLKYSNTKTPMAKQFQPL